MWTKACSVYNAARVGLGTAPRCLIAARRGVAVKRRRARSSAWRGDVIDCDHDPLHHVYISMNKTPKS